MCGRFSLFTPPTELAARFGAELAPEVGPDWRPRWNIGPSSEVLALTEPGDDDAHRLIGRYRWGLVPSWAKDTAGGSRLFNARGETVATKPSFRSAFAARRAVVLADGFFEWRKGPGATNQPYYFHRADGEPMAFAGLWETWHDRREGDAGHQLRSCTVITTTAGQDMAGIHARMPVVLEPGAVDRWLEPHGADRAELESLLRPCAEGTLAHHAVDRRAGNVRNDDPGVIAPAPGADRGDKGAGPGDGGP